MSIEFISWVVFGFWSCYDILWLWNVWSELFWYLILSIFGFCFIMDVLDCWLEFFIYYEKLFFVLVWAVWISFTFNLITVYGLWCSFPRRFWFCIWLFLFCGLYLRRILELHSDFCWLGRGRYMVMMMHLILIVLCHHAYTSYITSLNAFVDVFFCEFRNTLLVNMFGPPMEYMFEVVYFWLTRCLSQL